jgi:hypothetical protein
MRRRILMAVLALGAIGGFGSGFAHLHHMRHGDACHPPPHAECAPAGGAEAPPEGR